MKLKSPLLFTVVILTASMFLFWTCGSEDKKETESNSEDAVDVVTPPTPVAKNWQAHYDSVMWAEFIKVVAPKGTGGTINDIPENSSDYISVFETWKNSYFLFEGKNPPTAWDTLTTLSALPPECLDVNPAKVRMKNFNGQDYFQVTDEFVQSGIGTPIAPLVDAQGKYVRTEVLYNKIMYNYFFENEIYNPEGMVKFARDGNKDHFDFPYGSVMLKLTWKELDENDTADDFFQAQVYNIFIDQTGLNAAGEADSVVYCDSVVTMGLVGMHVSIKTQDQPEWIWSTFEHIDNAPNAKPRASIEDKKYNFFNYALINKPALDNKAPMYPEGYKYFTPVVPDQTPTQVTREEEIPQVTQDLNATMHGLLSNTVWANYELIGTQYQPMPGSDEIAVGTHETDTSGFYPTLLANATLETYEQLDESCGGCHFLTENQYPLTIYTPIDTIELKSDYSWSINKGNGTNLSSKQRYDSLLDPTVVSTLSKHPIMPYRKK
jgi:hypothetical protein